MAAERGQNLPVRFPFVGPGAGDIDTFIAAIRRLARARSLEEVMATATSAARSLLDADGITFVLRDGDSCHYADEDAISRLWKGRRFPMDACISGWCMKHRGPAVIPDIYKDERIPHDAYRPTFVHSLAMVPVDKEQPQGAMGAYWASERDISSEEVDLLQTMADAAVLAIANVQLRENQEVAELMKKELGHRVKNIFSVVLALIHQTSGDTKEKYREALEGRLDALEKAHAAIFEAHDGLVDVPDLIERLVSAYAPARKVEMQTDRIELDLSVTETSDIALIIHELSSNAAKYGAFSNESGWVKICCKRSGDGLHLVWQEADGPPVQKPSRIGFGTRLVEAVIVHDLGGSMEQKYQPDGYYFEALLPFGVSSEERCLESENEPSGHPRSGG